MDHDINDIRALAVRGEFRKIVRHRSIHVDLALLVELHHGGGRHEHLGERRHVEDGVRGHLLLVRNQRAPAVGAAINDLAVMPDDYDSAWVLVVRDALIHD